MLTNKDYCDYETCVALKELGLNDPTTFYYGGDGKYITIHGYWRPEYIQRFSLYEAQKFLREEKDIVVRIIPLYEEGKAIKGISYTNEVIHWDDGYVADECIEEYDSYEEALLEGVRQAIEILKEK